MYIYIFSSIYIYINTIIRKNTTGIIFSGGFPSGRVDKNLSEDAGDMGLIPGPRRSHMSQSS